MRRRAVDDAHFATAPSRTHGVRGDDEDARDAPDARGRGKECVPRRRALNE